MKIRKNGSSLHEKTWELTCLKIRIKKGPGCNMQKKGGLQRKDTESSTLRYIMGGTDN